MNEEILLDIKVQDQNALANIVKLTDANEKLKAQLVELKKSYKDGTDASDDNVKSQAVLQAQIKENTNGIRENSKEIKTNAASVASAESSINGMRARIADLTKTYNSLSKEAREGDVGKQISSEMLSLNEGVNTANKSVGNFKDNIGNYPKVMEGVIGSNSKAGRAMDSLGISANMSAKQMARSIVDGAKSAGNALKTLAANPIVLFFVAIGAVVAILVGVFKDFKPVVDKLEQAMAALDAVFSVIKNSIIGLLTGQKSLSESTKGLGSQMAEAAKQAAELKKAQQELEDSQDALDVANKRDETQIQKLMLQSKNRTLSEKERIALLDEAQKKSEDIFQRNKAQSDEEVRIAQQKIIVGKNFTAEEIKRLKEEGVEYARQLQDKKSISDEEIENYKNALLKREDVNQQYIGLQEKAQNKIDALNDAKAAADEKAQEKAKSEAEKRQAAIEKAQEKEIKSAEDLLTIKKQQQKELNETLLVDPAYFQERLKQLEGNAEDEKKIENIKLKYKKISAQEYKIAIANIEKEVAENKVELQKKQAEEFVKLLDYELQLNKVKNQQFLIDNKLNDKQLHENRLSEIEAADKETREKLKLQKEAGIVDETEYNRQIVLLNAEKNLAISEENKAFDEAEAERHLQAQAGNYANELELLNENSTRAIEIKKAQLDEQMRIEKASAEKNGANILLIEKKYAKLKDAVDKQAAAARLEKEKTIADGVATLFTQTTVAGKIAASASTAIETYKGAQAALASMAGAGPVGWALGAVEAAVIIANGVKTIANINGIGVGSTASVSSSTADTTSSASSTVSSANSTIYTNLPTLGSMYSSNASQNETSQVIAESTPVPVVRVSEINEVQNTVKVKENSKY